MTDNCRAVLAHFQRAKGRAESNRSPGHRREGAQAMALLQRQNPECFGAAPGLPVKDTALAPVQPPSVFKSVVFGVAVIASITALGLWLLKRK